MGRSLLSIIIPTLNEEDTLEKTLNSIAKSDGETETIVADGGSSDSTVDLAKRYGTRICVCSKGRGMQLNKGASFAKGDILLFLHADTLLPKKYDAFIKDLLAKPNVAAGAFTLHISSSSYALRTIEWICNSRARLRQRPYGDHALFLRKALFEKVGGFPEIPLMEDIALIRKLKTLGHILLSPATVTTSARRWEKLGVLSTTVISQLCIWSYTLGVSPEKIAHWYYRSQGQPFSKKRKG